jgi:acid phosphatase type 7
VVAAGFEDIFLTNMLTVRFLGKQRGRRIRTALLLFVLANQGLRAAEAEPQISKGPYIQVPGPGQVSIMWESPTNLPGTMRYGRGRDLNRKVEGIVPRRLKGVSSASKTNAIIIETNFVIFHKTRLLTTYRTNDYYLFEAILSGLKPGVSYSYDVSMDGLRTPVRSFRTLEPGAKEVRFIAYGDTRTKPKIHAALAGRFLAHQPAFILHTGDLVDRGKDYAVWSKEFFKPLADVIDEVPLFSVMGNHEEDGTNYLVYFHQPGNGLWYSFDAGPVHVLALDYRFEKTSNAQFKFASNDLMTARAPWKIVMCHHPMFNVGGHMAGWGHTNYLPLFHQAKVDLVLGGHSHLYERFRPVRATARPEEWPITCITTGGGGAELHASRDHPSLLSRETTNHYIVFEATRDALRGRTLRSNGTEIDRFELTKKRGAYAPDYLAGAFSEESLRLFYDIAPNLAGRADALPTPERPAHVLLTIEPRKKSSRPAEMEITLAPASTNYYELANGPLAVTVFPKGGTNQEVWAEVRTRGVKKITEEPGRVFGPPLLFQARITAEENQVMAFGGNSRLSRTAEEMGKKLWPPDKKEPPGGVSH